MTAALIRNVQTLRVAGKTEIILLLPGGRLEQLVFVVRNMWIVAGQAVSDRRLVHVSFYLGGIFVAVAGKAELVGGGRGELNTSDVFGDPDLVAAEAARSHGRVDRFALVLLAVTFKALGRVGVLVKRNRVDGRESAG
jgi:hypothetical protein